MTYLKRFRIIITCDERETARKIHKDVSRNWYNEVQEYMEPSEEGRWVKID